MTDINSGSGGTTTVPPTTPPVVSSISPVHGIDTGSSAFAITGKGFTGASAVLLGTTPAASFVVVNDTTITGVSAAGPDGTCNVYVQAPGGTGVLANGWTYYFSPAGPPGPSGSGPATLTGLDTSLMTGGTGQAAAILQGTLSPVVPADARHDWMNSATNGGNVVLGFYEGVSGSIVTGGIIADAQFTTAGGQPSDGQPVYLALGSDDGGTAIGKLTATPPIPGRNALITRVGYCLDSSNYASGKTCKILIAQQHGQRQVQPLDIYWDPASGSDSNNGTSGHAVKTWTRVKRILGSDLFEGGVIPIYANINIHVLSSQPDATDKVDLPFISKYGTLTFLGTPTVVATSTMTTVTTRVRSPVGSVSQWRILDTSLAAAGTWTTYLGDLIVDTTQSLSSFVDYDYNEDGIAKTCGTQEWFTVANPGIAYGVPANGDAYTINTLPTLYPSSFNCDMNAAPTGTNPAVSFNRIKFFRDRTDGDVDFNTGLTYITFTECLFDCDLQFSSAINVLFKNCRIIKAPVIEKGAEVYFFGTWVCMNNPIDGVGYPRVRGILNAANDSGISNDPNVAGGTVLNVDGGLVIVSGNGMAFFSAGGNIHCKHGGHIDIANGCSLYGGYGVRKSTIQCTLDTACAIRKANASTWANTLCIAHTGGTDFALGGLGSTACSPASLAGGISATVANLDLATGSGGFGGTAWDPGGGSRMTTQ